MSDAPSVARTLKQLAEQNQRALLRLAEQHRREKSTMTSPTFPDTVDYSFAGIAIDMARSHLDESIPSGQKVRSEAAATLMASGLVELLVWMRAAGYSVPVAHLSVP